MSRRQAYRVPVPDRGDIRLSVEVAGWPAIAGRICDATADGLGVSIPSEIPLPVVQGERLRLTIWLVSENRAITLDADVMTVQEEVERRRYGVRFLTPERARQELSNVLGIVFNRRAAPRVAPARGTRAVLKARGESDLLLDAAVNNISETGLGVSFLSTGEVQTDTPCVVSLELEDDGRTLSLPGRICNRRDSKGMQTWGIAIDLEDATIEAPDYEHFRAYVIDRARVALQPTAV